jgi:AcrR family transcriptional regulator
VSGQQWQQKKGIRLDVADPKQLKRINTIVKVSAELFSTKGYLETSVDDIAAAAELTKGAVYYYFDSKAEILYLICSTYVDLDIENLEQSLAGLEGSAEKIRFIVFNHINHYATNAAAAKVVLHESYSLPPRYLKEVRAREKRYYRIVSRVISEFLGEKARKEVVTTLAFTLFGMMNWIYAWYNPKNSIKPEELSRLIYEVFKNGVINSDLA